MADQGRGDARALERLRSSESRVGLCSGCRHLVAVATDRSLFVRCARAVDDDRFARYPILPVLECPGFEAASGGSG